MCLTGSVLPGSSVAERIYQHNLVEPQVSQPSGMPLILSETLRLPESTPARVIGLELMRAVATRGPGAHTLPEGNSAVVKNSATEYEGESTRST